MAINIRKIKSYWEKHGTVPLFKKALPFIFSYVPLNYYCISQLPKVKVQSRCPLDIRKGSIDDLPHVIDLLENDEPELTAGQINYLFDTGGELFLAFSENRLAHVARLRHYPGVVKKHPFERDPLIKLEKDEVYIGHCETRRDFKGMNIYPVVLQHIANYSFENGKKRCFGSSSPSGIASIKGIEKAGLSFVGRKRIFRVLGKTFNNLWSSSEMPNKV